MSQAIVTTYRCAVGARGSAISARCSRGSIRFPYPHEISGEDRIHRAAASALIQKFLKEDSKSHGEASLLGNPWGREFVSGCIKTGTYAHVFTS